MPSATFVYCFEEIRPSEARRGSVFGFLSNTVLTPETSEVSCHAKLGFAFAYHLVGSGCVGDETAIEAVNADGAEMAEAALSEAPVAPLPEEPLLPLDVGEGEGD